MKEHPILFSAPMVTAILAGRKKQTRRAFSSRMIKLMSAAASIGEVSRFMEEGVLRGHDLDYVQQFSPYGQPGDRLWVREAWRSYASLDDIPPRAIAPGAGVQYEAGGSSLGIDRLEGMGKYRPSMFMPRWASRIDLEITDVRVERLQDIREADAIAEGIARENVIVSSYYAGGGHHEVTEDRYFFDGCSDEGFESAVDAYAALWESLNGAGSWSANPWVWVVEFRRMP